jgi:hypothetical protein
VAKEVWRHAVGQESLMKKRIARVVGEGFWGLILACQKFVPKIIVIEDNTRRTTWWIEEHSQ